MTPFLRQVADHYFPLEDFSSRTFVFPNRRSAAFFRKHVCSCAAAAGRTSMMPECVTINDLFSSLSSVRPCDRITQVVRLYDCYRELYPNAESLDEFICWGDVLLGDFNDVDKYLVDPRQLFTNVSDLKSIEDDFSYMSEAQKEAIRTFLSHFRAESTPSGKERPIKDSFLKIWNILLPLYETFNELLRSESLAYEGMIYREVASLPDGVRAATDGKKYVFVGLNALNECEKKLLRHLRDAGSAEFCWDWSGEWIRDPKNRASFFMEANVSEFQQAFRPDICEPLPKTAFNIVSVSSSIGQAKQLPYILERLGICASQPDNGELSVSNGGSVCGENSPGRESEHYLDCAIVLPDEELLLPVLNSIPGEVKEINVTMGYPMKGSDMSVLMGTLAAAQKTVIMRGGETYFYHRHVRSVLSNNVFRKVASEEDNAVVSRVLTACKSYIELSDFAGSELLELFFTPMPGNSSEASDAVVHEVVEWQKKVISCVGARLSARLDEIRTVEGAAEGSKSAEPGKESDIRGMDLDLVFAKEWYRAVCLLGDMHLDIRPETYLRLLDQLLAPVAVPFSGEPLKGLQVMGPLETRALDFRNLIILSSNEGTFPRKSFSSSFIPPELRKGFGLPTYEYQDAVWAYYFYRMIQRCDNVWMLYDSRTEDMKSGEESRYIKQLEYLFDADVHHYVTSPVKEEEYTEPEIAKTPEHLEKLTDFKFSATALQSYLSCPAKFYYSKVLELSDLAESVDGLDGGTLGTVFHDVMAWIYSSEIKETKYGREYVPIGRVDKAFIEARLSEQFGPALRSKIKDEICNAIKSVEVRGKDIVLCSVIEQYVRKTLEHDLNLLEERKVDHFTVLAIEKNLPFVFRGGVKEGDRFQDDGTAGRKYSFKGFIDRLDSFSEGTVRIVDYKTGKVTDAEADVTRDLGKKKSAKSASSGTEGGDAGEENAVAVFDAVFAPDSKERPKIALQFFIYNLMLRLNQDGKELADGKTIGNAVYSVSGLFKDGCREYVLPDAVVGEVSDMLRVCLDGMFDIEENPVWRRTEDADVCKYCDFRMICGR